MSTGNRIASKTPKVSEKNGFPPKLADFKMKFSETERAKGHPVNKCPLLHRNYPVTLLFNWQRRLRH